VGLEEPERQVLAAERALRAQPLDREGEERPHELVVKRLLGRSAVGGLGPRELRLGLGEIEREQRRARRTLLAHRRLLLVGDEAVEARPQIGSKAALVGIVRREEFLLECPREESLSEILRVL